MTALDFRFHHITLQLKQIRYTFLAECFVHTVTPSSSRPYIKRNFEYQPQQLPIFPLFFLLNEPQSLL